MSFKCPILMGMLTKFCLKYVAVVCYLYLISFFNFSVFEQCYVYRKKLTGKLERRIPINHPPPIIPLFLTPCISVGHLLQLLVTSVVTRCYFVGFFFFRLRNVPFIISLLRVLLKLYVRFLKLGNLPR